MFVDAWWDHAPEAGCRYPTAEESMLCPACRNPFEYGSDCDPSFGWDLMPACDAARDLGCCE